MVDSKAQQTDCPISLGSSLDTLTPLQTKAFQIFPYQRTARRQLFIENAPTEVLQFCVDHYENGTSEEQRLINHVVGLNYGFHSVKTRNLEWLSERDADFFEGFRNCFDLIAVTAPYLPLMLESSLDLIQAMPRNMRRAGIPCTRENQRARYLLNVITYSLPSRTKILDSYRAFIFNNREAIERNLVMILDRRVYTAKEIRSIIGTHPALISGNL